MSRLAPVLLLLAAPVHAWEFGEGWSWQDTTLCVAQAGLSYIDYRQTSNMVDSEGKYREINGILPEHPTQDQVDVFFICMVIARPVIAALLPHEIRVGSFRVYPRVMFLGVSLGATVNTVQRNHAVGLGFGGKM